MGDNSNNYQTQRKDSYPGHSGAGMEALISAIERERQSRGSQYSAAPPGGYAVLASIQEQLKAAGNSALEEADRERLIAAAAQQASLFPNLPPSALTAGAASHLWNPMGGVLSYGLGVQHLAGLIPQAGLPRLPHMPPDRDLLMQADHASKNSESSEASKEIPGLPLGYPSGLTYLPRSGLPNLPADKLASVHEVAASTLGYPSPSALSPYLKMPGYPGLLPGAQASGIIPSMAALNPLGAYAPYYQSGLMPRLPHMPQLGQNALLRMPLNTGMRTPPSQPLTPEAAGIRAESPTRVEARPQSGGYLPLKENLQRRLSAPPSSNPQFRMPSRNEALTRVDPGKSSSPYQAFPAHRAPLPHRLVASTADPNKQMNRSPQIDSESIGKRISDIISQNEKILCSPQLDRVKPRRVVRRSSLDPCTLSTPPVQKHAPLTATHSAPRLDTKYSNKPILTDKNSENFLTVPPQSRHPDMNPTISNIARPKRTIIPDPRRDPTARPYIPDLPVGDYPSESSRLDPKLNSDYQTKEPYFCLECKASFSKPDALDTHKRLYCPKRSNFAEPNDSSNVRRSVIQHTISISGDTPPPHPELPSLKVTPPETETMIKEGTALKESPPICNIHRDLHRTRSADAAFIPRKFYSSSPGPNVSPTPQVNPSPAKIDSNRASPVAEQQAPKSSIPTNKLPPKKKQLQLMRSNSTNPTNVEPHGSPSREPSPLTFDTSPTSQGSKTPEESPLQDSASSYQKLQPPLSLALDAPQSKRNLPPWISMDKNENPSQACPIPPTVYMQQPSPARGSGSSPSSSSSLIPSPTKLKSPTSPKSPTRRTSPGRGSRSPSRSPTSNLESTVPRSNYKLLLHQISLRNMQDMGYLSEAYHHSKDKDLKRNIASLLWSKSSDGSSSKRMRTAFPGEAPNMEELYPGKAMLARRLSPNADSRSSSKSNDASSPKIPLAQSRSRPYESNLEVHPTVTRSHSVGNSSDVNNNIKQYLQNKSRNQQQKQKSEAASQKSTKGHKPLTRTNANARYLLKSPSKSSSATSSDGSLVFPDKMALESRNSLSRLGPSDSAKTLKDSLALKRAASYNPESSSDYQVKRQKLIPILSQKSAASPSILPASLVTANVQTTSDARDLPKIKSINPHTVQTPFLLHPHGSPSLGYEPHPTFCSLVSPQPMYVELEQSTVSMYSQWAVSEPILPKGMTVMDIFKNMRFLKALSPYISYNSLFTEPQLTDKHFKVIETKEYKEIKKKDTTSSDNIPDESSKNQFKPIKTGNEENMEHAKKEDDTKRRWMFSQAVNTHLEYTQKCFTSCHNKPSSKHAQSSVTEVVTKRTNSDTSSNEKKFPKLPPPKVFVHPPSPEPLGSDGQEHAPDCCKNNEIVALEFSDCDTDDDAIKAHSGRPFLALEKRPSPPPTASSYDATMSSDSSSSSDHLSIDLSKDIETANVPKNCLNRGQLAPIQPQKLCDEKLSGVGESPPQNGPKTSESRKRTSVESAESEEGKSLDFSETSSWKNHRKIRKSRKERNASSPRLQKRSDGSPRSPPDILEDPSLAVHPIGACSEDPTKICALCRMKAKGTDEIGTTENGNEEMNANGNSESCGGDNDNPAKPSSPSSTADRPETPGRPQTPTIPRVRTPTSTRPRTPVPLTVSVPKRNRDRSGSKSGKQPLTPGILDKARGKGTTQHWVSTSELQTSVPSPKQSEPPDEKPIENTSETTTGAEKNATNSFPTSECFSATPPNRNPVSDFQKNSTEALSPPVSSPNSGFETLAAVVSGVMRSAAIQSKKKTKNSKSEMSELLSHSRPLIPTSEINGSASKSSRGQDKTKSLEAEKNSEPSSQNQENALGSLANLTSAVGPNRCKPSMRHLSLTARESELFLNKANEASTASQNERKAENEHLQRNEEPVDGEADEDHHSDGAKDEMGEGESESSNPRPYKCAECKVAFRIAGHLAKHLRSKGHVIAMQKKTLNRLKQQKLSTVVGQETAPGGQGVASSVNMSAQSPDQSNFQQSEELLTQLGEAQVRALFEGNEEYAEINTGMDSIGAEMAPEASDDEDGQVGSSDPRPFKCIACKVAFRFQGHLDRHFRSNTHLLAVGHFERDVASMVPSAGDNYHLSDGEKEMVKIESSCAADHHIIQNSEKENGQFGTVGDGVMGNHSTALSKPFVDLNDTDISAFPKPELSESNPGLQLDDRIVNQVKPDSDWSKSVKVNNNISKVTVNGLNHSNVLDNVPNADSLNSLSIRSSIQSNQKPCYETPPTLQEIPLPSTSPVPKIQQLSC